MGCGTSKLEDLEALALCRARCGLLGDAIRNRYALADAHAAYADSLSAVGAALYGLFDCRPRPLVHPQSSPVLPLPAQREGDPVPRPSPPPKPPVSSLLPPPASINPAAHSHSRSHSGSHIHFHSSDDFDSDGDLPFHLDGDSPIHFHPDDLLESVGGPTHVNLHYTRNNPAPPSVSFEQRVESHKQVHYRTVAGPSSSSYSYGYSQNTNSYAFSFPYAYHPNYYGYGGMGGFFSSASPRPAMSQTLTAGVGTNYKASASRAAPPPPSPPRTSTWDFLNPFESFGSYYPTYTPSRSSKEVREDEGIPDLEEDELEVIKEAYGDQKIATSTSGVSVPEFASKGTPDPESKGTPVPESKGTPVPESKRTPVPESKGTPVPESKVTTVLESKGMSIPDSKVRPVTESKVTPHPGSKGMLPSESKATPPKDEAASSAVEGLLCHPKPKEEDENVIEKSVVGAEVQKPLERRNRVASRRYHDVSDVSIEIRIQFERAAESTKELNRMLEVGKRPYNRKSAACAESSRMMCVLPISISKDEDLYYEEDKALSTGNLSSTLQKLYIWERKLLDEVKVEEKMRLLHDRNSKKLQILDEKGAEAHRIKAVQKMIRKLSTRIRIEFQFVSSISTKISVLREKELWPQIDELIHGFGEMWKVMFECHQIQLHAISEAEHLDSISSRVKLSDAQMNAVVQLELHLLRWIGNFSAWINLQKNFVKSLNAWLVLCLHYEPELTADGIPPYSPGRIGAPPLFVIFNCWSQALDRISEKEVLNAMQAFSASLQQLWQQSDVELHQTMVTDSEMDRLQKKREREAQLVSKEIEALNKKLVATSSQVDLLLGQTAETSSLHSILRQVFEALENFSMNSIIAYEDLYARAEEEKAAAIAEAKGSQY